MPASRGYLERFRPSGTPGAAAGAGVPADRIAEREAELADVFARMADTEAEVQRIRQDGTRRAEEHRSATGAQAAHVRAMALADADVERRNAASRIAALADEETETTMEAAEREVAAIRTHAADVLPAYSARVMATIRARLGLPDSTAGGVE